MDDKKLLFIVNPRVGKTKSVDSVCLLILEHFYEGVIISYFVCIYKVFVVDHSETFHGIWNTNYLTIYNVCHTFCDLINKA